MPSDTGPIVPSPYEPGVYYVGRDTWQVGARYELRRVLGSGSFSAVCLAWDREESEYVALKRVGDVFASPDYAKRVLREVCIMRRLEHPNIIRLKDVFLKPSPTGKYVYRDGKLVPTSFDCYIAMEYCDQGDMFNMRGQLPEHEVRSLMWQLLSALRYLHGLNVWHRDIKTGNLLITLAEGRRVLKVADFGSARSAKDGGELLSGGREGERRSTGETGEDSAMDCDQDRGQAGEICATCGTRPGGASAGGGLVALPAPDGGYQAPLTSLVCTPCYRAPEVIMSRGGYSSAIDMWSAGCVFGELLQRAVYVGKAATPHLQVAPVFAITGKPLTPNSGQRYGAASEPGGSASAYAELSALFAVIGTPAWACIEGVRNDAWRRYLFHIPGRAPTLHRRFNHAGEVAVDLLARLLQFDPGRRASAEESMAHEYFAMMHVERQLEGLATTNTEARVRALGNKLGSHGRSAASARPDDVATVAGSAGAAEMAALPTWPPGRSPVQCNSGTEAREACQEGPSEMDVAEGVAEQAAGVAIMSLDATSAVRNTTGGCSLLTKRKLQEDPIDDVQTEVEDKQCVPGLLHRALANSSAAEGLQLSFWQLDDPALALAAMEAELATLMPVNEPGLIRVVNGVAGGPGVATATQTPEAQAMVEQCKERLRMMLERECQEHTARAVARRGIPRDALGAPSSTGGSATAGSGSACGARQLIGVPRNNSEGALIASDGPLLGGPAGAAALHGHLRPDPGQQLDSSMIGYERVPYHADAAAARLEPEKHLWAGRHGEWTESSLAAQPREQGAGTWGVTLLPPGLDGGTAAGQAYMNVMRSQHAR